MAIGIDLRSLTFSEMLEKIAKHGTGVTGTPNTPVYENFKVSIQLRTAEILVNELEHTREAGNKASRRLLWLNIVLTAATVVLAVHAGIQIYQLFSVAP